MSSYTYNDMYNYENFPSDNEYELEENQFQLDEEEHFDKYCDILNETFNDMKKYTENCDNPELLQHLTDYMELDRLIGDNKYEFSNNIIQTEKKKSFYNDDIYIPGPVTWSDDEEDKGKNKEKNQKNEFVSLRNRNKNNNKIPLKQKYKKRLRERMTKNTKNILLNYLK